MSDLISGKEALIALANGEVVEVQYLGKIQWYEVSMAEPLSTFKESGNNFRLKTRTITLNGIEVPAHFEPKVGERYWFLCINQENWYTSTINKNLPSDKYRIEFGVYQTEEEIKQVVEALQSVFK